VVKRYGVWFVMLIPVAALSQGVTRQTFHDDERTKLKEHYQVEDTLRNELHGPYVSYYLNGKVESKGYFANNETTGVWEFFYESGNLKMRGALRQNSNYGWWEYFFENGQKSMEGTVNGTNREGVWTWYYETGQVKETGSYAGNQRTGIWKTYFEDGVLKGEADYTEDYGRYIEYYHSGKVLAEGPKNGSKLVGHWRYYSETDGSLNKEGDYENNLKHGLWKTYHSNGTVASHGMYVLDEPQDTWEYFNDSGKPTAAGSFDRGKKEGYWVEYNALGKKISEGNFTRGSGELKMYYPSGRLQAVGKMVEDKREGLWLFYDEAGRKEGECMYTLGKGVYKGYYPEGALQTKGELEGDKKVGTWEIYERDGTIAGYYKPFYENEKLANDITKLSQRKAVVSSKPARRLTHFDARSGEFRGVIIGGNPVLMFAGRFPFDVEFYAQERLGHEFEFIGIREPFFTSDENIAQNKVYDRGYSIALKQKLYNPIKAGMWYLGHELRFTNVGHFVNVELTPDNLITLTSSEQRIQYGGSLGYRIMQRNNAKGFTLDLFLTCDVGYRYFSVDQTAEIYFEDVNQNPFVVSGMIGFNLGYIFAFR
jgi:antitoxin component YwqK of YwqJK toxin-antitoxin module